MARGPALLPPDGPAKATYVGALFSRIADRYDLLNDLMTAGRHRRWKQQVAREAAPAARLALDIGTGTGDLAFELARQGARRVIAADMVPAMVATARRKAAAQSPSDILFLIGDALALPFQDQTFDCVTSGFLVRNVVDPVAAFAEMRRVLKPGGRVVCLETSRPRARFSRFLLRAFSVVAPLLGRLAARDGAAYAYLPASAAAFATAPELTETMRRAGLAGVHYRQLAFGLATIHQGVRADDEPAAGGQAG